MNINKLLIFIYLASTFSFALSMQDQESERDYKEEIFNLLEKPNIETTEETLAQLIPEAYSAGYKCKKILFYIVKTSKYTSLISLLVNLGVDINIKDRFNSTPLIYALKFGKLKVAQLILSYDNIDVNVIDNNGYTALMYAVYKGYRDVAELILQYDPDVNIKYENQENILMQACFQNLENIIQDLLDKGIDVNSKNNYGVTALIRACDVGNINIVKTLLACEGIDIDVQDNKGWTPLMYAANKRHNEVIRLLLEHKKNITAIKDLNRSSLPKDTNSKLTYNKQTLFKSTIAIGISGTVIFVIDKIRNKKSKEHRIKDSEKELVYQVNEQNLC
ncbi:ankyrin repeat domain-containing protein [Candidatus Babela massiliensis]|uniref:Ankyrin repeats containing protein n=1 Tax=Candidatus Babela massiliensis TaxID=673862 RepID=V6DF69_9BACT|nr:ankyrin repeat domain-containing protein [Candidatus Babela massiliensis]CDK30242.1 Ankyrin repeats containing protein [Candidatus Babela massiliensis]